MGVKNSTVLITGGAGFVGSKVAKNFISEGAKVHILDDFSVGNSRLVPSEAIVHDASITDSEFLKITRQCEPDVLIHLAALHHIPYCVENPIETFETNVLGTHNVLSAAEETDVEAVLFSSSAAVYEPKLASHTESDTLDPIDIYGQTKLIGELLFELFHQRTGQPTTVLRLFNIYGPNETNPHLIPEVLEQIKSGKKKAELGNLSPKRDFIHVSDVVNIITECVQNTDDSYRTYNVGTGTSYSVREVIEHVSGAMNGEIEIQQSTDKTRENDRPNLQADIASVQEELDWTPDISFGQGISTLIE